MLRAAPRRLAALLGAATLVLAVPAAQAVPTCTGAVPTAVCGGRVVADPLLSLTFVQQAIEFAPVLAAIEAINPDVVEVATLAEWLGDPAAESAGGRDLYVVRVTDESVTTPKRDVAVSLSVHATETAGREGGLRYLEDLARWSLDDPDRALWAGDTAVALDDVLAETEIWLAFLNPDGWAAGDVGGDGGTFERGNANGQDLNRQFPTWGWTGRNQMVEPEAVAWARFVEGLDDLTTASDLHGELVSATDSFADIMYPAGQWDARELAQERQFAADMARTIERKFEQEGVVLQTLFDAIGEPTGNRPMKPAAYATAYDIVGYDDSGFMGDWFVLQGAVEVDVENFLSHIVPGNAWVGALEQAHTAAVKGEIEAAIAESMIIDAVTVELDLGDVAYVDDPTRVQRDGDPDAGEAPFDASRMDFFDELDAGVDSAVDPVAADALGTADLSRYDSLVVADLARPPAGSTISQADYAAALDRFAQGGGQLVLLDQAVGLLADLGLVRAADVRTVRHPSGHVVFGERTHRWEQGLDELAEQTFYGVPLGYTSNDSANDAPNRGIASAAFAAIPGSVAVGTTATGGLVNLGEIDRGDGSIAIFGSILPTQTTDNRIDWGLADYAMSVTGGEVLMSILEYERA